MTEHEHDPPKHVIDEFKHSIAEHIKHMTHVLTQKELEHKKHDRSPINSPHTTGET
jgi:hypothetical protein